jgi:hypothetical protein
MGRLACHRGYTITVLVGLPVKLVKRRHVATVLSDLRETRGDSTADHVRSSLSSFFTWVLKLPTRVMRGVPRGPT